MESQFQTDETMNKKLLSFLFVVAVIFTIAIVTGPDRVGENGDLIKALQRDIYNHQRALRLARDSIKHFQIMADTYFNTAESLRKSKTVYVTKYKNEVKRIDSLSDPQLDSSLFAIYPKH